MNYAFLEFKDRKKYLSLVLLELIFATLTVFYFLNLFGLNLFRIIETRSLSLAVSTSMLDFGLFAASLILFALVFFAIKKRVPVMYSAQQKAASQIKFSTMKRVQKARTDPRVLGLLLIEFIFVVMVFVSVSAFFDPETELIPWAKLGLLPPATTIVNAVLAIIVLAAFYWIYRQTSDFRISGPIAKPVLAAKPRKKRK